MGMWPNTYAFTKALGEDVVRAAGKGLPIAVIRPSIVIGTAREPIEGWTNNLYGPNGVVAGAGLGLLRSFYCNKDFVADLVPVDLCVNAIIALPWYRENIRQASEISTESKKDPPILNYISSHKNPITWGEFMKHNEYGLQRPSVHCIWYYFFALNKNYFMHLLYVYILQMVPAMILDLVSTTLGKTPILWKTYRKIHRFTGIISYFSMKEFKFEDNNVDSMWEKMGAKDRQLFDFNIASLNWKSTISNGILGLRIYLVNDPIETLPEAKKRFQKLKIAHYTLMVLFWLMIIYLVFKWALLPFFNFLNLH